MPVTKSQRINRPLEYYGRLVFILAILFTIILVVMGMTGVHWPKWLLAVAMIL
jgi:hypothetical protein